MLTNLVVIDNPAPWDPGTWSDPYGSLEDYRFEVDPTASGSDPLSIANALQAAYDALPLTGGTIRIYPGTDPYVLDKAVICGDGVGHISKPVRIYQELGSELRLDDGSPSGFRISCPFEFYNANIRFDVGSTTSDRAFFKLVSGDSSVSVASGATGTSAGFSRFSRSSGGNTWEEDGYKAGDMVVASGFVSTPTNRVWKVSKIVSDFILEVQDVGDIIATSSGLEGTLARIGMSRNFRLIGGRISLCATNAAIPGFFVVQATGYSADNMLNDLTIENVSYEIRNWTLTGTDPVQQTHAWTSTEYTSTPYGLGFARFEWCRHIHIKNCKYIQDDQWAYDNTSNTDKFWGGIFFIYRGCHESQVEGVTMGGVSLCSSTQYEALPLFLIDGDFGNECGHLNISNIRMENVAFKHCVYSAGGPWLTCSGIWMGRVFPGYTVSAFRFTPTDTAGRSCELINCTTHNTNGPQNSGSFTANSSTGVIAGTNIGLGIITGDWIEFTPGDTSDAAGYYKVTSRSIDSLTVTPKPADYPGYGGATTDKVKQQTWVAHWTGRRAGSIRLGNHTLRKSSAPPYWLEDCESIYVDPWETLDTPYTGK